MTDHFASNRNPVFYIAEIGGNHEGDFEYALRLCKLAIEAGADAVKFQLYRGDFLVSPVTGPERNKSFKRFELTREQHIELAERVRAAGRHYMASVWDEEMLSWIDPYIDIHKVGSGDLTHFVMLKALVSTGKPIILSTGLSTLDEVKQTVDYIISLDQSYLSERKLSVLQCTAAYPTPDDAANLRVITTLADTLNLPAGYSDHTLGSHAVELSYVLGARIIEKHFTDTREGKTFRDHLVSLTCAEVKTLLARLENIETMLGSPEKILTEAEKVDEHQISFRRSLHAKIKINPGDILSEENVIVLRPKAGICASRYFEMLGKPVRRSIEQFAAIQLDDIGA